MWGFVRGNPFCDVQIQMFRNVIERKLNTNTVYSFTKIAAIECSHFIQKRAYKMYLKIRELQHKSFD